MNSNEDDYLESYNSDSDYEDMLFYTPKVVQHIDDSTIIEEIFIRFPKLKEANEKKQEKDERKYFAEFLNEKELINDLLTKYNISIIDLIKLFYRKYSYIFNTITYSNKLKRIIEINDYPTETKQ